MHCEVRWQSEPKISIVFSLQQCFWYKYAENIHLSYQLQFSSRVPRSVDVLWFFFVFNKHETVWEQKCQNATPPTNRSYEFWNFSWNFLPMVLTKLHLGIFEILKIVFSFSLTWDPIGVKISKNYSSYKSQLRVFKLLLKFLTNGPHKITFGDFWNFKNWNFEVEKLKFFFFCFR